MEKIKKLLWLDDIRNPLEGDWLVFSPLTRPYDVFWVKSYLEFIDWVNTNGLPDGVCFDHDLADNTTLIDWSDLNNEEKTGYDVAKWLVDYCVDNNKKLPLFNIQSANRVGSENIRAYLNNAKKHLKI